MKINGKTYIAILHIVIIIAIGAAVFIYNVNFEDTSFNSYLTGKKENKTFVSHTNQKYTNDSMSFDFIGFTGKWSFFELKSNKESTIVIKDNSNIDEGELYIVVLDSKYNNMAMKKANELGDIEFIAQDNEKYFLRVVGKEASGHFNIKINTEDEIRVLYKEFWQ